MKWFYNLKIGTKLIIAFIAVSLITVIVGLQGLSNIGTINDMLNSLYLNETMGISYIKEANIDLIYFGRAQNNFLLASTTADRLKFQKKMDEYEDLMKKNIERAKPLIHSEEGKRYLSELERSWEDFRAIVDEVVELGKKEDLAARRESVVLAQTKAREKSDIVDTLLSRLARVKENMADKHMPIVM
jgi:methyl-accepting chemotaxis protein